MTGSWWLDLLLGIAAGLLLAWAALIAALAIARPRGGMAREALRLLPDVLGLLPRLVADRSLPRGVRIRLALLLAYLAIPVDLVPDFIPAVGYADDATIIAAVLRSVVRRAGIEALRRHWRGTNDGFAALCRITGLTPGGVPPATGQPHDHQADLSDSGNLTLPPARGRGNGQAQVLLIIAIVGTTVVPGSCSSSSPTSSTSASPPRFIGYERADTTMGALVVGGATAVMVVAVYAVRGTNLAGHFTDALTERRLSLLRTLGLPDAKTGRRQTVKLPVMPSGGGWRQ